MIYVDDIQEHAARAPGLPGKWCHMWTDGDDAELDDFAKIIGLKHSWSQTSSGASGRFYHYDLRPSKRTLALQHGAQYMRLMDWIKTRMKLHDR